MGRNLLDIQMVMETFAASYYAWPLMVLLNAGFVVIAFTRREKIPNAGALLVFGIGALVQDIITLSAMMVIQEYHSSHQQDVFLAWGWISAFVFAIIDALTSYTFFLSRFSETDIRKKIIFFRLLFIIGVFCLIIFSVVKFNHWLELEKYKSNYIVFASFFALIPPFYYFNRLLTSSSQERLTDDPAWWVACGFIIVNATIIPLFLMEGFLPFSIADNFHCICYLLFCALFILFNRSFYCLPRLKNSIQLHPVQLHKCHKQ